MYRSARRKGQGRTVAAARVRAEGEPFLDLFAEENRLNVYAGELQVRPPLNAIPCREGGA
jgi:hypothetical protein